MNKIIKTILFTSALVTITACNDSFLDISDPNNPTATTYYTSLPNAQLAVNGVYAGLQDEALYFGNMFYVLMYSTGEANYVHPGPDNVDFNTYNYGPTNSLITKYYEGWYKVIGRANDVIAGLSKMKETGDYKDAELTQLENMLGQCYFLRGYSYSFLIRSFGEKMPTHPAYNENLPGVIIADTVITSREQMYKDRSSCGDVYKEVLKNFQLAEKYLPVSWPETEAGKATKGSAQAYLGETYMYLKDWANAKIAFDKVLGNTQYQLMTQFAHNFDYEHINNAESIFEVGFNNMTIGGQNTGIYLFRYLALQGWGTTIVPLSTIDKFSSSVVINAQTLAAVAAAKASVSGPIPKARFDKLVAIATQLSGTTYESKTAFFEAISSQLISANVVIYKEDGTYQLGVSQFINALSPKDPRLASTVYTPKVDYLVKYNPTSKIWERKLFDYSNYGMKKYIPDSLEVEGAQAAGMGRDGRHSMNIRVMRLVDVYLYYAEVMAQQGNTAAAKEYINKVVRRANGLPVNTPSAVDVSPVDIYIELKNQTYLETCLEGKVWFHYRRWNLGKQEWAKYGYKENKNECLPIPQDEFDSNPAIKTQNIGYY